MLWLVPATSALVIPKSSLLGGLQVGQRDYLAETSWLTATGPRETVIVGSGPTGLATALMLASRGWRNIRVVDKRPAPASADDVSFSDFSRHYLIGLGMRGQRALAELDAWTEVEAYATTVVGRKDWAPGSTEGVERIYVDRPYKTRVLSRDRLAAVLYEKVKADYGDVVHFQFNTEVDFEDGLRLSSGEILYPTLVVAADGAARTVANALETKRKCKVVRYEDDNRRVFKTLPFRVPWRFDLNYSARSKDGRVNFDALPASEQGDYNGVLLLRADDPLAQADSDPAALRELLDAELPQFSALIDDRTVETVARQPPNNLPTFRYVENLVQGDSIVMLGDAAHTVKPYFGLGANSALEDVVALQDALDTHASGLRALEAFAQIRGPEARAMVQISRGLDRPGKLGFITFILPLILDGIFHKLAPKVFATNAIAMMQQDTTFASVQRRKRRDRFVQVAAIFSVAVLVLKLLLTTRGLRFVGVSLAAFALYQIILFGRRGFKKGAAPADVLAATNQRITANEAFLLKQRLQQPDR